MSTSKDPYAGRKRNIYVTNDKLWQMIDEVAREHKTTCNQIVQSVLTDYLRAQGKIIT